MSWTLIEHQALTSSVASVTLGSGGTIPQTYKTLKLVYSTRSDRASTIADMYAQFNGNTSNYSIRLLYGDGSAAGSSNSTAVFMSMGVVPGTTITSNTFASGEMTIPNYSSTTANKPASVDNVTEYNNASWPRGDLLADLWSNTSAITSIAVICGQSANFVSGSTFTLYGLA